MRSLLCSLLLLASTPVYSGPLFEVEGAVGVVIQGNFEHLLELRDKDLVYRGASISYREGDYSQVIPIRLQARGKTRLDKFTCSFLPLRLHFSSNDAAGTLFENQKKLKLVTQCHPEKAAHRDYLVSEYLVYKMFNVITENSYRVRLAEIRYLDKDDGLVNESAGFFLEPHKKLARRIGRQRLRLYETSVPELDRKHLNLVSLFQFMIGNTDWSATHTSREECCHNGKLYGQSSDKNYLYVPYDFDYSGFVNADYARPAISFGLKSVRERRYGGYCSNNHLLPETIRLFNTKRMALVGLIEASPHLSATAKEEKISYIQSFFDIINDPVAVKSKLHSFCYRSDYV